MTDIEIIDQINEIMDQIDEIDKLIEELKQKRKYHMNRYDRLVTIYAIRWRKEMLKNYIDLVFEVDYKLKLYGIVFIVQYKDGNIKVIGLGEETKWKYGTWLINQ